MEGALSVIGVGVLAFVATNLDNLMLLVGIASRAAQSFASIVAGALLACIVTLGLGVSAALATDLVPQRWLGMLGVVPIAFGLRELTRLVRSRAQPGDAPRSDAPPVGVFGLAGLLLANSSDSIAALVPLLAETRGGTRFPTLPRSSLRLRLARRSPERPLAGRARVMQGGSLVRRGPHARLCAPDGWDAESQRRTHAAPARCIRLRRRAGGGPRTRAAAAAGRVEQ